MTIITNTGSQKVDTSKGFDVIRGKKVVAHYDTYEAAKADSARRRGSYIQFYLEAEG